MKSSYLDCAATTEPNQNALKAAMPYLTNYWHNPSALYGQAQKANQAIELARKDMSDYIKAKYNEIYFTSGGSESNCWAIQGFIHKCIKDNTQPVVITSKIEHKSIMECVKFIHDSRLANVYYVDNDCYGYISLRERNRAEGRGSCVSVVISAGVILLILLIVLLLFLPVE